MIDADFLNQPPVPVAMPELDPTGPGRFYNRELSWLGFNWRVLEEAENPSVPLLERLRFLSISANNLDEFYTVRVAGLRELAKAGNTNPAADGMTPAEQLVKINEDARNLLEHQQTVLSDLRRLMAVEEMHILSRDDLTDADRDYLGDIFLTRIFPVLSPLAIDPAHPFPFIPNLGFSLALQLERKRDRRPLQALLPIPIRSTASCACPPPRAHCASCRWRRCCWSSSTGCSRATATPATAPSACCATATWRSRKRPRTWCASSRRP